MALRIECVCQAHTPDWGRSHLFLLDGLNRRVHPFERFIDRFYGGSIGDTRSSLSTVPKRFPRHNNDIPVEDSIHPSLGDVREDVERAAWGRGFETDIVKPIEKHVTALLEGGGHRLNERLWPRECGDGGVLCGGARTRLDILVNPE